MGKIESVLGVEIFEWQDWDDVDIDVLQFYDVKFKFDSLKKYNDKTIAINRGWSDIEVFNNKGDVIANIDLWNVPEFIEAIKNKI